MSNTRRTRQAAAGRPARNKLFAGMTDCAVTAGWEIWNKPGRTLYGTVLADWLRSICQDGVLPHCPHAVPGQPALLHVDDPEPMARCGACMWELLAMTDDRTCHLCGSRPETFREFMAQGTGQLVICGNVCLACFADISAGRPAPNVN